MKLTTLFTLIQIILTLNNNKINCESNDDILNTKVERLVDLSTHLAKVINVISIENIGKNRNDQIYALLTFTTVNVTFILIQSFHFIPIITK